MCCSRPAGGEVVQVESGWPSSYAVFCLAQHEICESDQGNDRHPRHRAQTRARANRSRAWVAAVSLWSLLLLLLSAGACAAVGQQTAIITVRSRASSLTRRRKTWRRTPHPICTLVLAQDNGRLARLCDADWPSTGRNQSTRHAHVNPSESQPEGKARAGTPSFQPMKSTQAATTRVG